MKLNDSSDYELFILHNGKMYELEKIDENYHIKREITDINPNLYMDDVFYDKKNLNKPIMYFDNYDKNELSALIS